MRLLLITTCICCFCICQSKAQQRKIYSIKAGEIPAQVLPDEAMYVLPSFTDGQLFFRDGSYARQKFNYNCAVGEMQFINDKGDTLAIADPTLARYIKIDTLNFYFDKDFVQSIAEEDSFKLAVKQKLMVIADKTHSGYDIVTSSSSISTFSNIITNGKRFPLQIDKDVLLTKIPTYYLGDRYNHFLKADKKAFLNIFGNKNKSIQKYLKENSINFNKEDDLRKLFKFCVEVNE